MSFERGYAIGDENGPDEFLEGADLVDAVKEAEKAYPGKTIFYPGDLTQTFAESPKMPARNPACVKPESMPVLALQACGLPRIKVADIEKMTLEEAHAKLLPFFQMPHLVSHGRSKAGDIVAKYDQPGAMARAFLTENAKLSKGAHAAGIKPGYSRGPALMPHSLASKYSKHKLPMQTIRLPKATGCGPDEAPIDDRARGVATPYARA